MRPYRSFKFGLVMPSWVGAVLVALLLAGCVPQPATTPPPAAAAPPLAAGMARVWFLRQADPPGGNIYAADPMVYVDRAPLSQIKQGTFFSHDFLPGRYRLSVQAFGTPAGQHDIVQLDGGDGSLCPDRGRRQLGIGLAGRRLQLCRPADVARIGEAVSADPRRYWPALTQRDGPPVKGAGGEVCRALPAAGRARFARAIRTRLPG